MEKPRQGRLILVRHGETEANQLRVFAASDDIPLTAVGRAQALELAHRLSRECRPDILVSSHFARALETSAIIGRIVGLSPESVPGLHERDFGELRGQPYARLAEFPHAPEPLDNVRRRAIAAIESLRDRYPAQEIIVVCHGAVIQSICAHITGVWTEDSVPPNCGLVVIEHDEAGWRAPILSGDWQKITPASSPSTPGKPRP